MNQMFIETVSNPFKLEDPPSQLVNFVSGVVAKSYVQDSLLDAINKGQEIADKLVNEIPIPSENEGILAKSFYITLPSSGVKTLSDMVKNKKMDNKDIKMNAEVVYLRLLAINAMKKVPIEHVNFYENSPMPLRLFTEDGNQVYSQYIAVHAQT